MPVPIVRRNAIRAFVAATALAAVVAAAPFVAAASTVTASDTPSAATALAQVEVHRVDVVPGSTEARYRAQEVLVSRGANEAVGRTTDVTGQIHLNPDGSVVADLSRITVDMRTLQSDSTTRDNYIKRSTIQVAEYPTADFVVMSAPGLPSPLPTSGEATFELVGDLTIHGVTRPATWQTTATFADRDVTGTARTTIQMTDFGMTPPKVGSVVSIEDAVQLELDVKATVAPSVADMLSDPG